MFHNILLKLFIEHTHIFALYICTFTHTEIYNFLMLFVFSLLLFSVWFLSLFLIKVIFSKTISPEHCCLKMKDMKIYYNIFMYSKFVLWEFLSRIFQKETCSFIGCGFIKNLDSEVCCDWKLTFNNCMFVVKFKNTLRLLCSVDFYLVIVWTYKQFAEHWSGTGEGQWCHP